MLVLTRKQNEKIKIGNDITITVLRMKGKGVRLGIQAPEDMNVLRGELVFDIEDDSLEQEVRQNDSVLEPKTVPTGGSSGIMTSNRFAPRQLGRVNRPRRQKELCRKRNQETARLVGLSSKNRSCLLGNLRINIGN